MANDSQQQLSKRTQDQDKELLRRTAMELDLALFSDRSTLLDPLKYALCDHSNGSNTFGHIMEHMEQTPNSEHIKQTYERILKWLENSRQLRERSWTETQTLLDSQLGSLTQHRLEAVCRDCAFSEVLPDGYDYPFMVCTMSDTEVRYDHCCSEWEVK